MRQSTSALLGVSRDCTFPAPQSCPLEESNFAAAHLDTMGVVANPTANEETRWWSLEEEIKSLAMFLGLGFGDFDHKRADGRACLQLWVETLAFGRISLIGLFWIYRWIASEPDFSLKCFLNDIVRQRSFSFFQRKGLQLRAKCIEEPSEERGGFGRAVRSKFLAADCMNGLQ